MISSPDLVCRFEDKKRGRREGKGEEETRSGKYDCVGQNLVFVFVNIQFTEIYNKIVKGHIHHTDRNT